MIQRNFAMGEVSSAFYGGADQARYQAALRTCRNFILMRAGGAANRPGTEFCAECKDPNVHTTLLKFIFDADQSYAIEAGHLYFRFYRNGARVIVTGVLPWDAATAYVVGDHAILAGVNYYCILAHTNHTPPNVTYWYPLTGAILEIPTPYEGGHCPRLQYEQTGDVITLTHRTYPPMELKRYLNRWTLTPVLTAPTLAAPTTLAAVAGAAGALPYSYVVTACREKTYEESLPSIKFDVPCALPVAATPNTLTWDAVTGAAEYNVYVDQAGNGVFYFIGIAAANSFNDPGIIPDGSLTPPIDRPMFVGAGDYPAAVATYQQRRVFAGTDLAPEEVIASRVGARNNFTISSPIQDDDAVTFTPAGKMVSEVRHMLEVGRLVLLSKAGEWIVLGDPQGALLPTAINPRAQSNWGASWTPPAVVGKTIIYTQARGSLVRDLRFSTEGDGTDGRDLTIFATHLVEGFSIDRMDYAQSPHSIVWAIRSDGTLLGLTYLPDFDSFGWHRHDTDGVFEDVAVVPETTPPPAGSAIRGKEEDAVYVIVRRTIGGVTKRYVERFASRRIEDYRLDGIFLDSCLTYNGINATATTVTITTASSYAAGELLTATASAPVFVPGDVGKGLTVWLADVGVVRIVVSLYVSPTVVKGAASMAIIPGLQASPVVSWSRAVSSVTGLAHLEGKAVSVLANGVVLSGTVTAGVVALGNLFDVVHVGLAIEADFETLDLDSANDAAIRDKRKLLKSVSLIVDRSRGIMAGPDASHLLEFVPEPGSALGLDVFTSAGGAVLSEVVEMNITATWQKPGRIFIRQSTPLPLAILAVITSGELGT